MFYKGIKKAFSFIRRYTFTDPLYVLMYAFAYFKKEYVAGAALLSEAEVSNLIKNGKSILRIGDGEVNLLLGLPNHYQSYDANLRKTFQKLIKNYSTKSHYVLAVPRFLNTSNQELKKIGKFNVWLPLKVVFNLYFNKQASYIDAHAFYYDGYFERVVSPHIKDRHIILVTKADTITDQSANPKLPFFFSPVVTPAEEMIEQQDEIQSTIERLCAESKDKDTVVLLAAGPVGKVIGYHLAMKGIQCIDIGKVAEVMHTGASIEHII